MTNIRYPDSLPPVRSSGFQSQYQDPVVRTQMDAGPAKQRLRYTAAPKRHTASIVVDETEREIFEAWFVETLGFGALRFVMENPQTLDWEEFRFIGMYGETELDGLFELSLPLERMA
jgi:hypothetical protein